MSSTEVRSLENQHPSEMLQTKNSREVEGKVELPKDNKDNSKSDDNWGIKEEEWPRPGNEHEAVYPLDKPDLTNELKFFKKATGIEDEVKLKSHIMKIREMAYKRFPYPCIWLFDFLRPQTLAHPFYTQVKKQNKIKGDERKIYIDFGPFIGTDLRQVLHDGWNRDDILGVDITKEWQELGWQLFNDRAHAPPIFAGDIFKSTILDVSTPAKANHPIADLDLRKLKDLNNLKGSVKFISAFKVFHLFSEIDQRDLAVRCGLLLSNESGAAIFGKHLASHEEKVSPHSSQFYMHSPKSWKKLWTEILGDKIEVTAELQPFDSHSIFPGLDVLGELNWMVWSVVRV